MTTTIFNPAPDPPSSLGRYRLLSPKASVRVSPLCLGGMSLGQAWKDEPLISGGIDKADSFKLLDAFWEKGGNFIDTANSYQWDESEQFIGEWMESRKNREEMVIATKYTTTLKDHAHGAKVAINYSNAKSMHISLEASLKKLRTSYVDILYLHWWDWSAGVEEIMQALNRLVVAGKVLYLGVSDTPAWIVTKANMYARANGMAEFIIYQGLWNVNKRDFEREIIPMCQSEGLALAPWGAISQGRFRTAEQVAQREKESGAIRGGAGQSEAEKKISGALEKMGKEEFGGASITQMALAYVLNKTPNVFPLIGGTKISYLEDNIKALDIHLSDDQIARLESVTPFEQGFPYEMILHDPRYAQGKTLMPLHAHAGHIEWGRAPTAVGRD